MYKKVEICGITTSNLPKKNQNEIEMMLVRLKNGDMSIKDEFIRCNLRLVLSIVQKFTFSRENIDDIFQIGCIGLIKAIDNFDFKYNVKFSTYAVPMVIGEIKRYLRDNSTLRVSRSIKDIAYKAMKLREGSENCILANAQIAEKLGVSVDTVDEAMKAICEPCSLYDTAYQSDKESISVIEHIKDENDSEESWIDSIALREAIKKLEDKEKQIISLRYYKGKTQTEVANKIGISQAQVSRIEKNALNSIKKQMYN